MRRYCAAVILVKVGIFQRGKSLRPQILHGRGRHPQLLLMSEKQCDSSFIWYQNIGSMLFHLVAKHTRQTKL